MSNNNIPIEEDSRYLEYCYESVIERNIDLERQLEKAREALSSIQGITYNNHDHDTIRINKICNEQLKEQG
jgi:hypothetical protein